MKTFLKITGHLVVAFILTLLTQIGGLIWIIIVVATRRYSTSVRLIAYTAVYLVATLVIVPLVAQLNERTALPYSGTLRPYTLITCLLNRHYVHESTFQSLTAVSKKMMTATESPVVYLDAGFPLFDGFPLFPHLSHSDGKKVDLAFYYLKDQQPVLTNSSLIGYGYYEQPGADEIDYAVVCRKDGYWQYGLLASLIPASPKDSYQVDADKTRTLIRLLHEQRNTQKIFLEPYLTKRWRLRDLKKIRFHGCHAVRHDDHLHWQTN